MVDRECLEDVVSMPDGPFFLTLLKPGVPLSPCAHRDKGLSLGDAVWTARCPRLDFLSVFTGTSASGVEIVDLRNIYIYILIK